jgi:hypothetical protein
VQEDVGPVQVLPHLVRRHLAHKGHLVGHAQVPGQLLKRWRSGPSPTILALKSTPGGLEGRIDPQLAVEALLLDEPRERKHVEGERESGAA